MKTLSLMLSLLLSTIVTAQDLTENYRKLVLNSPNNVSLFQSNSTNGVWASGMVMGDRWGVFEDATTTKEWLTVQSGGNIGIGTTSPQDKLQIGNSMAFHQGGHAILYFYHSYEPSGTSDLDPNKYSAEVRFDGVRGNLRLGTSPSITDYPITHMTINKSGNVGIGTTTPDAKLAVKGDIHAQEVQVDLTVPAPDYVFKEGYDLKSLEEVQNYIQEHGHLPDIPSAQEMEANGIQLGEMNMKLLEKIEELTLYMILQQELLFAKNSKISSIEKELALQQKSMEEMKKLIQNRME